MANKLAQIGLAVNGYFNDLMGGIAGKTKALRNLGIPSYVWTSFKSIANEDWLNPEGQGYRLSARDIFSLRNIRSSLQTQVEQFFTIVDNIKNTLSNVFPNATAKSTVCLFWPSNGSTEDLKISVKKLYIYNPTNGAQLPGRIEVPITITPTSRTECKLDWGRDNGVSPQVFIGGQTVPVVETSSAQTIYDFDMITLEWNEGTTANPIIKRRTDMAIAGPFFDSYSDFGQWPTTDVGGGAFNYVFNLCRGSGDDFQSLLNNGAVNVPVTLIKKQPRQFGCAIAYTIPSDAITSISRTNNIAKIMLRGGGNVTHWLGEPVSPELPITDNSDNRILPNQPIIVRASGLLSDYSGAFNILSVDKIENSITYYNYSPSAPNSPVIANPAIEVSVEPFFSQPLRQGESVSVSLIRRGNNAIVDHYTDLIIGESYNDGRRRGFYLYGKQDVNYRLSYHFEAGSANPSWGYRQAAILTNFANSELKGAGKFFTARQLIRGFSAPKSPSFSQGKILSTSKKSFWNRLTAKTAGTVLGIGFPGEVEVNGSLEIKQQINFGDGALLTEFPASLTGQSSVSPFYDYFNRQKTITHLFQLRVGGEICYIPAVSLEEQPFKYEQVIVSRQATLTQTALVSLDKFYTSGNVFTFPKGGSFRSSANHTNLFFGELFQPLVRSNSRYSGLYENTMPFRDGWKTYSGGLKPNKTEVINPALNAYYEAFSAENFSNGTGENFYASPRVQWRSFYNAISAAQPNTGNTSDLTTTLVPTNSATIIAVLGFRTDWATEQPEGLTDMVPQSILGQGVDWDLIEHKPTVGGQTEWHVDNGLGWLLYTKGFDLTNRSIYFNNPGPYLHLTGVSSYGPRVGLTPERNLDYDKNVMLTKKFSPNLFYFLAMTFETRVNGDLITDEVMNNSYTAQLVQGYPGGGNSLAFLPSTTFVNGVTPTTVKFYMGSGTSSLLNVTPGGSADLKIIRASQRTPSYLNRFGRRLSVGISECSLGSVANGWWVGFSGSYFPYAIEKYRTCCPLNIAFLGVIDDAMTDTQLSTMYSIFRNGVFKDLAWGFPQDS